MMLDFVFSWINLVLCWRWLEMGKGVASSVLFLLQTLFQICWGGDLANPSFFQKMFRDKAPVSFPRARTGMGEMSPAAKDRA
jgi:hypothetical protein